MKTLAKLFRQDREAFAVPRGVQDAIPIRAVYEDGVFLLTGSAPRPPSPPPMPRQLEYPVHIPARLPPAPPAYLPNHRKFRENQAELLNPQVKATKAAERAARAAWKDVLAVYAVKTAADPTGARDTAAMDADKKALLQTVFRDMNPVAYHTADVTVTETTVTGDGAGGHVGIVESLEGETVYTIEIEGNTSDSVARQSYRLDSVKIAGYGALSNE